MTVETAIPAATLVLFRDAGEAPEHLFVVRADTMRFAGGAVVFPGGRVDPGDRELAMRFPDLDPDDAAGRIAAVRETLEEAGVAVALSGEVDAGKLRQALASGEDFGALLDASGLKLDLAALVPFARWCPNFGHQSRTFDTRFYLARAPSDADASVDATENSSLFWASAPEVICRADEGDLRIIFPTRRNLERLGNLGNFDAAVAHADATPVTMITPWIETRGDGQVLCIPVGLGYPVTEERLDDALRT